LWVSMNDLTRNRTFYMFTLIYFYTGKYTSSIHRLKHLNQFSNQAATNTGLWMVLINASYTLKYKASQLGMASLYVFRYWDVFMRNLIRILSVLPGWLRSSFSEWITRFYAFPKVSTGELQVITSRTHTIIIVHDTENAAAYA